MQHRTIAMEELPAIAKALDKVDEVVARLQQLQNTIAITRHAVSSSVSPKFQARSDKQPGEWKQWSAPAELLHQTLCDILAAAKKARQVPEEGSEAHQHEVENDDQLPMEEIHEAKGSNNKSQLLDEVEQSKFVTKPATCMQVSKVKESQKAWKLPQKKSKDAVMFPNVVYSPASPPKQFRILTPFKSHSMKKNIGATQKVPLLGKKKRHESPVHSLPTLIDRLPSKTRPGAGPGAGAAQKKPGNNGVVSRSKEMAAGRAKESLPYPPSHYSQADRMKRGSNKKTLVKAGGRSPAESTPQPLKPLECNAVDNPPTTDDAAFSVQGESASSRGRSGKQQHYVKLISRDLSPRARSISPRSDKENLLASDARGSMRRSWSAGNASALGGKNNLAGHSMLQRAKGWVLGKQHAKGTRF